LAVSGAAWRPLKRWRRLQATHAAYTRRSEARLSVAIAEAFNNASLLQQRMIGRTAPAGAALDVQPYCNRRGSQANAPGDWLCNVDVYLPQRGSVPLQRTNVDYDVSVSFDGCYPAQSTPSFIGGPTMAGVHGTTVVNPLFAVYGCFNTR
jgi:hypothetical protein